MLIILRLFCNCITSLGTAKTELQSGKKFQLRSKYWYLCVFNFKP